MRPAGWITALAASEALREAREAAAAGGIVRISGLQGAARLLVPLLLAPRPLLVVVPREREVEPAAEDLQTLAADALVTGLVLPFPAPGPPPFRGLPRHPDASLRRANALHAAHRARARAIVASPAGLLRPTLTRRLFETRVVTLCAGEDLLPEILLEALDEGGYRREDPVTAPGQVARRGGILDVFPPDQPSPVRLEFLGDTLESLRRFDPDTQRTTGALEALEVLPIADVFPTRSVVAALRERLPLRFGDRRELAVLLERLDRGLVPEEAVELLPLVPEATVPLWKHLDAFAVAIVDPEAVLQEAAVFHARAREERDRRPDALALDPDEALVSVEALRERMFAPPGFHLRDVDADDASLHLASRPVHRYAGDLRRISSDLRAREGRTVLYLGNQGRSDRLADVLHEDGVPTGDDTKVQVRVGALSAGFELPEAALLVLSDGDLFPEEVHLHPRHRRAGLRSFLSDFRDLKVGDLVVHQDHGIGRFVGLETLEVGGTRREFMVLGYQAGDKLKVPVENFDRVQKYASAEGARPPIDKLGSGKWEQTKRRVKKAMRDMAAELLKLYAERKARPGHAFTGQSPWQREFEESFEYEETPDQAAAIADVAADMASESPMDRLVCGDVGYGKTEVAMRAAMRAVLDGKQVAVLAPTTVLAFQHWKTFRKRFAPFPVKVEMVSRFRTPREIKEVLAHTEGGGVDVLIGTHRLLSRDVAFRDLGLLVVDEEQRFGVAAKEKLKKLRTTVDSLTLSATPIPRTLQMGLAGIRDMSVIETPPKDRLAIMTSIVKFSTDVIASAVRQELARDGQVFLVHNRVESIYSLANLVQRLVPEARVGVAHGQMPEGELEKHMLSFVEGRTDVLVATTLIENGLDIPRANTIVINRADRYGLAQLYQLRGRVGRADRRAYAYLLVPPDKLLSELARKRLAAIREFSELGAGFRIAALDLELRGAGNLLGGEQSGHIEAVGLDLYVKLLEQAILELKGQAAAEETRAALNLKVDLRVPDGYVPEVHQRMSLYKRISQVRRADDLRGLAAEVRDRYGPPPPEVDGLLRYAAGRLRAEALGISHVDRSAGALHVRFWPSAAPAVDLVVRLVRGLPGASLTPAGILRVPAAPGTPPLGALESLLATLEKALAPAEESLRASGL
ncbi:MAG TPA: transcription-repair coupling factor [Vicinamibacteria bacterium]|nr:transcription-repair coupling factor [Vicinamibacteria bacterium]